jgi:hypothetical protein
MESSEPLETIHFIRSIEACLEIILKLVGVALIYIFLNGVRIILFKDNGGDLLLNSYGAALINSKYQSEDLYNLLIFPILYVLKDSYCIAEPFFIKAYMSDTNITVESGIFTRKIDKLRIENLENIELVKTPLGRCNLGIWKKYGTLNLYAFGGVVIIPFLETPEDIQEKIEANLINFKSHENKE